MDKGIRSGDVIALDIDGLGFLSIPSNKEPIPERSETVSHMRVCAVSLLLLFVCYCYQ
jgi:hypothetical protein